MCVHVSVCVCLCLYDFFLNASLSLISIDVVLRLLKYLCRKLNFQTVQLMPIRLLTDILMKGHVNRKIIVFFNPVLEQVYLSIESRVSSRTTYFL